MKTSLVGLSVLVLASSFTAGCFRTDATATVDRGDHALVIDTGASGSFARSDRGATAPVASGTRSGPPGEGETIIVLGADEPLYRVADDRGLSLRWLIERNDLTRRPGPGDRIIVPSQSNP